MRYRYLEFLNSPAFLHSQIGLLKVSLEMLENPASFLVITGSPDNLQKASNYQLNKWSLKQNSEGSRKHSSNLVSAIFVPLKILSEEF